MLGLVGCSSTPNKSGSNLTDLGVTFGKFSENNSKNNNISLTKPQGQNIRRMCLALQQQAVIVCTSACAKNQG
jgi:hypothetical protein